MQALLTPPPDGFPAVLTLNGANEHEKQLIQALALLVGKSGVLVLDDYRINITLEQPPQADPVETVTEAAQPTGGEPVQPDTAPTAPPAG